LHLFEREVFPEDIVVKISNTGEALHIHINKCDVISVEAAVPGTTDKQYVQTLLKLQTE